jgi:hypothetical protein
MKKIMLATLIMSVSVSIFSAELPWKEKAPDMSKAPPTELEKVIEKLPLAKIPTKQPKKKKVIKEKPGAVIGMSREEVYSKTNWGKPESAKKIVNADGEWVFWYYNNGASILTFLDDELYEIEQSEDCE